MTIDAAIELLRQAMETALVLSAPVLAITVAAALVINVLQTMTQLHDQTLSFVPKLLAAGAALLVLLPWMLERFSEYARNVASQAPGTL